jgi:hypothetical protein
MSIRCLVTTIIEAFLTALRSGASFYFMEVRFCSWLKEVMGFFFVSCFDLTKQWTSINYRADAACMMSHVCKMNFVIREHCDCCFIQLNSLLVSLAMAVKWSWIMSFQPLVSFYWFRWEKKSSRFDWAEAQIVDSLCLFVKVLPRASLEVARKSGPLWFWGSESQDCKLRHCWYVCHQEHASLNRDGRKMRTITELAYIPF